jgi:hypothetical protein
MLPKAASGVAFRALKRSEAVWSANEQGQDQVHRMKTETKLTNSKQLKLNFPKFAFAVVKVVRGKDQ